MQYILTQEEYDALSKGTDTSAPDSYEGLVDQARMLVRHMPYYEGMTDEQRNLYRQIITKTEVFTQVYKEHVASINQPAEDKPAHWVVLDALFALHCMATSAKDAYRIRDNMTGVVSSVRCVTDEQLRNLMKPGGKLIEWAKEDNQ